MGYTWTGMTDEEYALLQETDPVVAEQVRTRDTYLASLIDDDPMDVADAVSSAQDRYMAQLQEPDINTAKAVAIASHLSFAVTTLLVKLRMECEPDIIIPAGSSVN